MVAEHIRLPEDCSLAGASLRRALKSLADYWDHRPDLNLNRAWPTSETWKLVVGKVAGVYLVFQQSGNILAHQI